MTVVALHPNAVPGIRIDDVIVGDRARRDYGDLSDLIASIREVGLLQPIGLTPGNHLLFGGRRLEACRALGWESIPFVRPETQTDAISLLTAERDENTCRKDMTPEELVDVGLRLEELERPRAEARQLAGLKRGADLPLGPDGPNGDSEKPETNRTAAVVGEALGMSKNTYKRAKHVVQTARGDNDPDPEVQAVAQEVLEQMNAGVATITGAYNKVITTRQTTVNKAPDLAIPQPPRMGGGRRKHLQMLQAMTTALAGIAGAAEEINGLDSSVTQEEAAQLVRDLSRQIRSLNQIKALLKERTR